MDRRLIDGLLRAVGGPDVALKSGVGQYLSDRSIGLRRGARLLIHEGDKLQIRNLLIEAGIDPAMRPGALGAMSRVEVAGVIRNEKLAGQGAGAGTVLYGHLPGGVLSIAGLDYCFPPGHYGRGPAGVIHQIDRDRHKAIIMVENEAALWALGRWPWPLPAACRDALILFRGSPQEPVKPVRELISKLGLPVWVAGDMDPAGLGIALTTPGFAGLICPPVRDLQQLLSVAGCPDLFGGQMRQWGGVLTQVRDPAIAHVFGIMKSLGRGITQEAMIARGPVMHYGVMP